MTVTSLPSQQESYLLSDLPHTRDAVSAAAERILAHCRQPAARLSMTPHGGAILLDQTNASPSRKWHPESVTHCHLIDLALCDPEYSVYALLNQAIGNIPAAQYVIVTPWHSCQKNAEYLRTLCLGERLFDALLPDILDNHLARIRSVLRLGERAANDSRRGYSIIRHGVMLRFDAGLAQAASDYFILDEECAPSEQPTSIKLGADCELSYVFSGHPTEPLRAILTDNSWGTHMATKELNRWLKSLREAQKQSHRNHF